MSPLLITVLAASLAAFLGGGLVLWERRRASLFLARSPARDPRIERLGVHGLGSVIYGDADFFRTAQGLRRRHRVPAPELDIESTLQATLQAGGWLRAVYATRLTPPEYLALVDRAGLEDQSARLVDTLLDRLCDHEVLVSRYYFEGDPRTCFPPQLGASPIALMQLASRYSHHRLLVFSDGRRWLDARTGEPASWSDAFERWPTRALLTPLAPRAWGHRELHLARRWPMVPATPDGLRTLVRRLAQERPVELPAELGGAPRLPADLEHFPQRYLVRHAPDDAELDALLDALRAYLEEEGYLWLAACAVYPALHWELTIHLGQVLTLEDGPPIFELRHLAALTRLPWFRYGDMPDWLRAALLESLPRRQERRIREEFAALLMSILKGEVGFQLRVARRQRSSLQNLSRSVVRQLIRKEPPDGRFRDHVFVRFMARRRSPNLALLLPERLWERLRPLARPAGDVSWVDRLLRLLDEVGVRAANALEEAWERGARGTHEELFGTGIPSPRTRQDAELRHRLTTLEPYSTPFVLWLSLLAALIQLAGTLLLLDSMP